MKTKQPKQTKPKPQPELWPENITAAELATITGYTDRWLRDLAAKGYFPPPIRGIYQKDLAKDGIIRYQREQIAKGDDATKQEQRGFMKAKREQAEFELARARGEYVERAILEPRLRNVSLNQRAVLIRKLEQELPPKLVGLTTPEILALMRSVVDELITIFREQTKTWCESPPKDDK